MRTGTIVYKYDQSGELVHTYTSFIKASKGEKVHPNKLKSAIENEEPLNGATFSYGRKCELTPKEPSASPDEKKEKYFNVESWRSICF